MKAKHILVVTALKKERRALEAALGELAERVELARLGMGPEQAERRLRELLERQRPEALLLFGSAGWLGHQPTTLHCSSDCMRMFQTALHLREVTETGRMPRKPGAGSVKPRMPCLSASLPVAIEVQSMGDMGGSRVARLPITPRLIKLSRAGILPASSRGWITFQSAASQPISSTFLVSLSAIVPLAHRFLGFSDCITLLAPGNNTRRPQGKNTKGSFFRN